MSTADAKMRPDVAAAVNAAKQMWKRQRPFLIDRGAICQPREQVADSYDYPSGHTSWGTAVDLVLAGLLPDRATLVLERGRAYGDRRFICGVHNLSAVESRRLATASIVARLHGKRNGYLGGRPSFLKAGLRSLCGVIGFALTRCRLCRLFLSLIRLTGLATQADALCHGAARFRIGRSDHGVISLQAITLAVLHWRHAVSGEVTTQRLVRLAIDHADDVIGTGKGLPGRYHADVFLGLFRRGFSGLRTANK